MIFFLTFFQSKIMHTVKISSFPKDQILPLIFFNQPTIGKLVNFCTCSHCHAFIISFSFSIFLDFFLYTSSSFVSHSLQPFLLLCIRNAPMSSPHPMPDIIPDCTSSQSTREEIFPKRCTDGFHFLVMCTYRTPAHFCLDTFFQILLDYLIHVGYGTQPQQCEQFQRFNTLYTSQAPNQTWN